jgi:hypothetical protein
MHIYETRFREEEAQRAAATSRAEADEDERRHEIELRREDRSGLSALSPPHTPLLSLTNGGHNSPWKKATRLAATDHVASSSTAGSGGRSNGYHNRSQSSHGNGSVPTTTTVRNGLQAAALAIQNEHDLSLSEGGRTHLYSLALRKVHDRHRHARTTASFFVDERRKQQKAADDAADL